MKCPKCHYLGFETSDRCRNCGYDFSLIAPPAPEPELSLTLATGDAPVGDLWIDRPADTPRQTPPARIEQRPDSYSLFRPGNDDEPLIKLPAAPRAPLSVRRAADPPRRPVSRTPRRIEREPSLAFTDEAVLPDDIMERPEVAEEARAPEEALAPPRAGGAGDEPRVAGLGSRLLAALIDHAILIGIDVIVIVCTLRISQLTLDDWRALPVLPMLAFLALVKLAYFAAFTAMGGQTIGKMASGIRVVADDNQPLDPSRAVGRALGGAVSLLSFGLGLIPALVGPERRAFHDRVAHTRVVDLPSA